MKKVFVFRLFVVSETVFAVKGRKYYGKFVFRILLTQCFLPIP